MIIPSNGLSDYWFWKNIYKEAIVRQLLYMIELKENIPHLRCFRTNILILQIEEIESISTLNNEVISMIEHESMYD